MYCPSCGLNGQTIFPSETNIHFPGKEGLDKPTVWVFPQMVICLNCGFTWFVIPEPQLRELNEGCFRDRENRAIA
jgi:hypothetical protein